MFQFANEYKEYTLDISKAIIMPHFESCKNDWLTILTLNANGDI